MRTITVSLKQRSYNIIIGTNILNHLGTHLSALNIGNDAFIITNPLLKSKFGKTISESLAHAGIKSSFALIPDSEKSKSLNTAQKILSTLSRFDRQKKIFIIALGGGVVGDVAGFVASIYKRGIPYAQVPTTLLAQIDSAIGGKTAVDLPEGKNLVGSFYQPRVVYSDSSLLNSLPPRQIRAGLAEVIKYGIIKDPQLFAYLEKNYKAVLSLKPAALEYIISRCASIKTQVVSADEREEKGIRTILNFGHTIGHAIETASGYETYNHGEAIALGMLVACRISEKAGFIKETTTRRIESLLKTVGLPTRIAGVSPKKIVAAHYRDKKFSGKSNKFVLIKKIGQTQIACNILLDIIKTTILESI